MTLTCDRWREDLSAWLDGELAAELQGPLEAHLKACAGCRRELAQLQALDAALGGLSAPVPPRIPEKVLARIQSRRLRWWQSLAIAASLLVGLILGGTMARDFYPYQLQNGGGQELVASLDNFHDFPDGSLGAIVVSYQAEEVNGS